MVLLIEAMVRLVSEALLLEQPTQQQPDEPRTEEQRANAQRSPNRVDEPQAPKLTTRTPLSRTTHSAPHTNLVSRPTDKPPTNAILQPTPPRANIPVPIQRTVIPNLPLYFFNSFHHLFL